MLDQEKTNATLGTTDRPFTLPLGATAPDFVLTATDGKSYSLSDFTPAEALVLFFTSTHCPFANNSNELTRQTAERFTSKGARFAAICSNSLEFCPGDALEKMAEFMEEHIFPWAFLRDETQDVARAYGPMRTPQFFIFDRNLKLIYTGRGVDQPRDPGKVEINDLENALEDYFSGRPLSVPLTNPIGCNLKWAGHDASWMPPEACDLVFDRK